MLIGKMGLSQNEIPFFTSPAYTIYADRVLQGEFHADALSLTEIHTNYKSPRNLHFSPVVDFKFSINGKDNESVSGNDHRVICIGDSGTTPVIKFGERYVDGKAIPAGSYLKPGYKLTIRLDIRDIFAAFRKQGYFVLFNGDKLYKNDFKGVFVAGNRAPLIWDFNNLIGHRELELKDPDGDGIFETVLILNSDAEKGNTALNWKQSRNLNAFPAYHSSYLISDALYNLSLEEMENAIEPDSTFRTGKEWSGVWTRDISYSIILSMAILQPKVAVNSLLRKVKNSKIVQDTGTGGAYPVSSDRMIWAVAAWEVYKVTGDKAWLKQAYEIIKSSAADDEQNVYDERTGLVHGESSFLDWREETYPRWMQPADIYESECLGTNAVHYQMNMILGRMSRLLVKRDEAKKYFGRAEKIRKGIEANLWIPEKGYYGQFLYGRNYKILSPRSESLGEALTVLFDIADSDKQRKIVNETPVTDFGITCIYPQIPNIPPYHNNAVWPFVETYWAMAAAKTGREDAVIQSVSAIYRAAALFLTNKENFVSQDGDYNGTQINSSNMLWSLSGNLAIVYKVFFGIQYDENSIRFTPFVPRALGGIRILNHYKYRNAVLDIRMEGSGNIIDRITMDGLPLEQATISGNISGYHKIDIHLKNAGMPTRKDISPFYISIETPVVTKSGQTLNWPQIEGAVTYRIIKNGKELSSTRETNFRVNLNITGEYQVLAVDKNGILSFASEPVRIIPIPGAINLEAEQFAPAANLNYQGYSGSGFVDMTISENKHIVFSVSVPADGNYFLDCRYANGNGPINTENKCAIRSLKVNARFAGTLVFPQRGKGEWSNWGMSNSVPVFLKKGINKIEVVYQEQNQNMNIDINQAELDYVRLTKR